MNTNSAGNGIKNTGEVSALQLTVKALLQTVSHDLVKAIHLGAIPHRSEKILLQRLVGESMNLDELYARLTEFRFARFDSKGLLQYREDVREILLATLKEDSPQDYREATGIALRFFEESSLTAQAAELPGFQREALYHLLILDEASGLRLLNERLEETCYFRQLGTGEMLVEQAIELENQLSENAKLWLLYFRAILDFVYRRNGFGERDLQKLAEQTSIMVLQALANWKLGQIQVIRHAWSEAITLYKQSLSILTKTSRLEVIFHGRVLMSLGNAYLDLAEKSGGIITPPQVLYGRVRRIMDFFLQLPFLILEWLTQRISFLPAAYSGTNYQDWIVGTLLQTSADWFRQAERQFEKGENPFELTEARLGLAKAEHQMGRWLRARQSLDALEKIPAVSQSRYRSSRVHLSQGQAYLEEGQPAKAVILLKEAADTFNAFQDMHSTGQANLLLGLGYDLQGLSLDAIESFLRSAEAFLVDGDDLALTRTIWNLESLTARSKIPIELSTKIESLLTKVTERHFLTRFPGKILRLYRRLALLLTLPVSTLLTALANAFALIVVIVIIENIFETRSVGTAELSLIFGDVVELALIILVPFWIGRGIYGAIGMAAAFIMGRQLSRIEQEHPVLITVNQDGIKYYSNIGSTQPDEARHIENQPLPQPLQQLAWPDITNYLSIDYRTRSRPIYLISRTLLQAGPRHLLVEGTTTGYDALKHEIEKVLTAQPNPKELKNYDFTFLEGWSTLASLLFSLVVTIGLYAQNQIELTVNDIQLPIGTIVTFTISIFLPLLITVILWRLWYHRMRLMRVVGTWDTVVPTWLILVAAILNTMITLGWILLLAFLP